MNEIPERVRRDLIASAQLLPQGHRCGTTAQLTLDADAIALTALEIVAIMDLESARSIAIDGVTDQRVGAAILELLDLPRALLNNRLQRARHRARQEWQILGSE